MPDAQHWRTLRRHALVQVAPDARRSVVANVPDAASRAIVAAWLEASRPLIVRRQAPSFVAGRSALAVGLPLPPDKGKLRIALELAPSTVARVAPPLNLIDVIACVPPYWQRALARLHAAAVEKGVAFRVFGSAVWQVLTGLPYLTERSDLDLLWHPAQREELDVGVALLAAWQRATGVRADGEIVFGDDAAVSWREWRLCAGCQCVLVKDLTSVTLRTRDALLALLPEFTGRHLEHEVSA
jgi:phosphoribosyl-dephospho-CoA transferase